MTTLKKTLLTVCSTLLFVCLGLCAVACGETVTPPTTYTVTTDFNADHGTVVLAPAAENNVYEEGASVTVTVTANDGYELEAFTVGGAAQELTDGKYTFTVTADTTVKATFKELPPPTYTVTYEGFDVSEGDVILSPPADGSDVYTEGESVRITVVAAKGYMVEKVTVNGEEVTLKEDGTYTFTVTEDTKIVVTFVHEPVALEFPDYMQGIWNSARIPMTVDSFTVIISSDSLIILDAENKEQPIEVTMEVFVDEMFGMTFYTYYVTWNEVIYTVDTAAGDYLLKFYAEASDSALYFTPDDMPFYTVAKAVQGTYSAEGVEDLVITEYSITWGIRSVTIVGDVSDEELGYYEYFLLVDGSLFDLGLMGVGEEWETFTFSNMDTGDFYEFKKTKSNWEGNGTESVPYVVTALEGEYNVTIPVFNSPWGGSMADNVYFSFTATADATYTLTTTIDTLFFFMQAADAEDFMIEWYESSEVKSVTFHVKANTTYLFWVCNTENETSVSFNIEKNDHSIDAAATAYDMIFVDSKYA